MLVSKLYEFTFMYKRTYFGVNKLKSMISHESRWYRGFSPLSHDFLFLGGKNMIESLERLKLEALESINECSNEVELNNVKSKYKLSDDMFNEIAKKIFNKSKKNLKYSCKKS